MNESNIQITQQLIYAENPLKFIVITHVGWKWFPNDIKYGINWKGKMSIKLSNNEFWIKILRIWMEEYKDNLHANQLIMYVLWGWSPIYVRFYMSLMN